MSTAHLLHAGLKVGHTPIVRQVTSAIAAANGDLKAAAAALGIERRTLYRWVDEFPAVASAIAAARGRPGEAPIGLSPNPAKRPPSPGRTGG